MYAPILCHGTPLGVICVDNPYRNSAFSQDDLRLLVAIAHQAAAFIANQTAIAFDLSAIVNHAIGKVFRR